MQFLIVGVLAIVFTVILFVGQTAYFAYTARVEREQREVVRRLNMVQDNGNESVFRERATDAAAAALGTLGENLQKLIESADSPWTVGTFLGISFGIAGMLMIVIAILSPLGAYGMPFGLLGAVGPYGYLRWRANTRSAKLVEQLPEALDLMARSLQAGLGLNEAFRTCAEEMPLPIAGEFGRVFEEVRLGRDYRDAFVNMLRRNPGIFDLRLFVSSVLLQRETGGNLIEILDSISNTVRGRFLFHAKVKAMTSEARFSALVLGSLPLFVGLILIVMNPKYMSPLFSDPLGYVFLTYFVSSYLFGGYLMYTISQVEV